MENLIGLLGFIRQIDTCADYRIEYDDEGGTWTFDIKTLYCKDSKNHGAMSGVTGYGPTLDHAAAMVLKNMRGKWLVYSPGKHRWEGPAPIIIIVQN